MTYDAWKTREPDDGEWASCDCCGLRKPYRQMYTVGAGRRLPVETWVCDYCLGWDEEDDDGPELTPEECAERTREMLAPCTDLAHRQGCTCEMSAYAYEEVDINRACPLHGSPAPEYEYEDRDAR